MLEDAELLCYNMNEVFTDHVRQYFDYTNDVELMRKVFPVLKGIVEWEGRRLQPEAPFLCMKAAWIRGSAIRTGTSADNARRRPPTCWAHRLLAELAEALGEDPTPYRQEGREHPQRHAAEALAAAAGSVCRVSRHAREQDNCIPQPELATIYHSAEFGAASPLQVYEMLHWVDNNLRHESTPGGGQACWSSNWFPNAGRSYTHSTYELAYGEQLNLALTNYLVGRADEAYALLRSAICGIYNGPTPGGLSCHMYVDGRQRMNNEFADSISMWGRAVVEGMYGIRPKRPRGVVELSPQFPSTWSEASIKTPQFAYRWKRDDRPDPRRMGIARSHGR